MSWPQRFRLRFQTLFHLARASRQLDDEVQFHLDQLIEENIAAGMNREDARYAAMRMFGNPTRLKEEAREAWGWMTLDGIGKDLRYAVRSLRANPLFTLAAVLSLALGIGANTAIFTLLRASLWKPLPVKNSEQIFQLKRASSSGDFAGEFGCSYPLYLRLNETARPFGEVFAKGSFDSRKFSMDGVSTERIAGEAVSANFFSVLGVIPILGRVLEPQDDSTLGGNHVAVLSHAFWVRRFHSDPSILGKTIFYDETSYTVVGIAQSGFTGIEAEVSMDVWVPVTAAIKRADVTNPDVNWLWLLARLHPAIDSARAQAMFEGAFRTHIADVLAPVASPRWKAMLEVQHMTLRPAASGLATTGRKYEKSLILLLAVVAVVLLISCANIANLIMARNAARRHEITVRHALGASRGRIACQLFIESLLLSFVGAGCGVVLSIWSTRLLLALLPHSPLPLAFDLLPDFAVLGFTGSIAVLTAVLFGLVPALRASREDTGFGFNAGQRLTRRSVSGRLLLVGQLALTLPLLIASGLFVKSLHNIKTVDLGFHPEHVITFDLSFPNGTSELRLHRVYTELKERLESHPGVIVAGYAGPSVYQHGGWSGRVDVPGRTAPDEDSDVGMISAGPGFFEAIGLGLVQGRYLNNRDQAEKPPVAVVNESFARHYFGSDTAIGQRIRLAGEPQIVREIVGVVRDARHYGVRERVWNMVYLPAWKGGSFFVRSNLNAQLLSGLIRTDVIGTDTIARIDQIRPFEGAIDDMISQERMTAALSLAFAGLACALAAIGLYGVVAYTISRRTNEFGVRLALGAQRSDIRGLVMRETVPLVLAGILIGIISALALAELLSTLVGSMLYDIKPTDVAVFSTAILSLGALALLAAFLPARRASRVDPLVALRYE